jgi:hypothetical protein
MDYLISLPIAFAMDREIKTYEESPKEPDRGLDEGERPTSFGGGGGGVPGGSFL